MDTVTAFALGDLDQRIHVEVRADGIAGARRARLDTPGRRGDTGVQRQFVDRRVDGDGLDSERGGCLGDTNGDLAPIGDQHALERGHTPFYSTRAGAFTPAPAASTRE